MYAQFDTVDPESDQHWIDKTQQAWKMFDKVCSQLKDRGEAFKVEKILKIHYRG